MYLIAVFCLLATIFTKVSSFCPSQCTCIFHGRGDGTGTRSVLCNDPDMSEIPVNVPVDTVKLRVEKTVVRQLPREAFYYLVDLRYLWLTYNAINTIDPRSFYNLKELHELRLDGNMLSTFPWDSLQEMPNLRTLDLHNNRLSTIPANAARYLRNITNLDISSNELTTLPSDLLDIWPANARYQVFDKDPLQRVILGFQDNPWFCDCRISKLIELSKSEETLVILMDPLLTCSAPDNTAGVSFQRVELEQCLRPSVMTSATKITSPVGSNVLLRCDSTGYPTPLLVWFRADGLPVNYTVIQESPADGIRWSIISLTGISYKDAGVYRCKAKNLAGASEAFITLTVVGTVTTAPPQRRNFFKKSSTEQNNSTQANMEQQMESLTTETLFSISTMAPAKKKIAPVDQAMPVADERKLTKVEVEGNSNKVTQQVNGNKKESLSLNTTTTPEQNVIIKNLRVISETDQKVSVSWKVSDYRHGTALNVVYSKYGEKDVQKINIDPSKNKISIGGLTPNTKYIACICPKGIQPKKEQCIVFSTEGEPNTSSHRNLLIIIGVIMGSVIVAGLLFVLCYVVNKVNCKRRKTAEQELIRDSYVKFETLSLRPQPGSRGNDLWTRRDTESQMLLLCSRFSIDSQMTFKSDSSRSEYLC
ncbi:leucine-rich repeat, immunoglobulin-like domain and transmembrane domain-containing protein 3b [Carcharodon carcharias]|uniref:leucine-rich repeat, immunoglobulin-like domain and transmembrane domain-containing protein 3b n=1 Tax=Carcharodon carcharias TaxID=13397 RepID=UPI001B7EBD60|nr:leucine-rich repeat, immunoglobulin-like domain and transmembrane domain-containing protein 3b [Carcharodon carcharias]